MGAAHGLIDQAGAPDTHCKATGQVSAAYRDVDRQHDNETPEADADEQRPPILEQAEVDGCVQATFVNDVRLWIREDGLDPGEEAWLERCGLVLDLRGVPLRSGKEDVSGEAVWVKLRALCAGPR